MTHAETVVSEQDGQQSALCRAAGSARPSRADDMMTDKKRIEILTDLLMSDPCVLVVCGLGHVKGTELAAHLLLLRKDRKNST